ncbi:MAG: DUF362 domain-containing protein [Pirellulaceae bacterium]|nr:DUF362 domain-containing protein [Pirellulaceae bacterium]
MTQYPAIFHVKQKFPRPREADVVAATQGQLAKLQLAQRVTPGQSVAITAGSRGIANIPLILKAIVDHLKSLDARPFLVPAMGSHGGGTAQGQLGILTQLGITPEACGCPIRASMETEVVCQAAEGFPVHFDRHAFQADHVVVCGRVKPHTGFVGEIESGLMKMLLVGLGKHEGAKVYHRAIADFSFPQILRSVAGEVLARCNVLAGVAILENGYEETAVIEAVAPQEFASREPELLKLAKSWLPKLPFSTAQLLLIDEIGKTISGAGMDTNVVGRKFLSHKARDDEWPKIKNIIVRGLAPATQGNGAGIGLAEFALTRAVEGLDLLKTEINALTAQHSDAAMIPIHRRTDREVLDLALSVVGLTEPPNVRMMWIRNTLSLEHVVCSAAYWDEAQQRSDLEILTQPQPLPLDASGMLPDLGHN